MASAGFLHAFTLRGDAEARVDFGRTALPAPPVEALQRRLLRCLGIDGIPLRTAHQVHGASVLLAPDVDPTAPPEADALCSPPGGPAVGVRTADCLPLLLADPHTGAVAVVHAGWRGCVAGVAAAAVERMRRAFGSRPATLLAAIGPHARIDAYEVGPEVAEALRAAAGPSPPEPVLRTGPRGRPHASLRAVVLSQLLRAGLRVEHVEDVGGCTVSEPARFFSFRREGEAAGRHLALLLPFVKAAER